MTPSTTTIENVGEDLVARLGAGWTRFWFTPSDPIVLSLMRILVGLVTLWWYLGFWADLTEWFGPNGAFSPDVIQRMRAGGTAFSLLSFADTTSFLWFIYGLGFVAIAGMIVGFFTRTFTIATLVWALSFIHGSAMMARPVDDILAMLLLYLCIAPAWACFSIDAWRRAQQEGNVGGSERPTSPRLYTTATLATRLMQVHLALIYAAMALAQLRGEAWWEGVAVWWLMARPESRLVDLTGLHHLGVAFIYFVNFLTHAIVLYEICFALLIWNRLARPILLVLGIFVWLGIALVGGSPSFCVLMLVASLAFLPPETLRSWCAHCPAVPNEPAAATA